MHVPALIAFLEGLAENNNKAWFVMNRPAYDILRDEFTALVGAVIAALATTDPEVAHIDPKRALFRIHRDLRFASDKAPYKTHFSAALAAHGRKPQAPMYYFHIDAEGSLFCGAGCYHPEPAALKRLRTAALANPGGLYRVLRAPALEKLYHGLDMTDALSRPPKGFDPEAPGIEYARLKSFIVRSEMSLLKRVPRDLPGTIATRLGAATPLVRWLRRALAEPST